jgi:hypothetical protein
MLSQRRLPDGAPHGDGVTKTLSRISHAATIADMPPQSINGWRADVSV